MQIIVPGHKGILDELESTGSEESGDVPRLWLRGEAPPAWKIVTAASSQKALPYASQTCPLNWGEIPKINNMYKVTSVQGWGKNYVRTSEYTVKASVQVVISSIADEVSSGELLKPTPHRALTEAQSLSWPNSPLKVPTTRQIFHHRFVKWAWQERESSPGPRRTPDPPTSSQ